MERVARAAKKTDPLFFPFLSPSPSSSSTPTRPPKPFGFRRFKGHEHDKEAAARAVAIADAVAGMDAKVEAYRTARRAHGASPLDVLLTRPAELRKRVGRAPAPGPGKK